MLAFGSLLLEGHGIRFTGQDVQRGTFSHRHAVLHDYNTGEEYTPLAHLAPKPTRFFIRNTMLSELATLGFEWGYASADPRNLVCWEAQFGDFVNGAQSIIDQIMVSAESKWRYMNGLCLQLPHGYEGHGPRAQQRLHRTVPVALRREQHPGGDPLHPGQLLPRAAPADPPQVPQAGRLLHAQGDAQGPALPSTTLTS